MWRKFRPEDTEQERESETGAMGLTRGLAFAITSCIGEMTDLLVSGIAGISSTVDFYLSLLANYLWSSKFFPLSSPTLDLSKRTNQEIKCSMQSSKRLIGTFIRYNGFLITANTRKDTKTTLV